MAKRIFIVGGLDDDADLSAFLGRLAARSGAEISWKWIRSFEQDFDVPPEKYVKQLVWEIKAEHKKNTGLRIVRLYRLHQRVQNLIHTHCDPVLVPHNIKNLGQLFDWLFSADANLIPRNDWQCTLQEAALVAILCKLIGDKSWNKGPSGHQWTKEEHLLGDWPVNTKHINGLRAEALSMMARFMDTLLLRKGGKQGKTPLEWCVNSKYVPAVKRAIVTQSLAPLREHAEIESVLGPDNQQQDYLFDINELIVSERVRQICRDATR